MAPDEPELGEEGVSEGPDSLERVGELKELQAESLKGS